MLIRNNVIVLFFKIIINKDILNNLKDYYEIYRKIKIRSL